jgi:hypothetical protein
MENHQGPVNPLSRYSIMEGEVFHPEVIGGTAMDADPGQRDFFGPTRHY